MSSAVRGDFAIPGVCTTAIHDTPAHAHFQGSHRCADKFREVATEVETQL